MGKWEQVCRRGQVRSGEVRWGGWWEQGLLQGEQGGLAGSKRRGTGWCDRERFRNSSDRVFYPTRCLFAVCASDRIHTHSQPQEQLAQEKLFWLIDIDTQVWKALSLRWRCRLQRLWASCSNTLSIFVFKQLCLWRSFTLWFFCRVCKQWGKFSKRTTLL